MGRYFSIKDVFKIISVILAIIMLSFVLYQFSGVIDVATSQFGGNNNLKDSGLDAIARGDKDFDVDAIKNSYANRSSSMAVMETSTLRVLGGENIDMRLEMASTTKIMTALVVLENMQLDKSIKIADEAVGVEGSSIYLRKNEIWTIRDLLYGLMLRSGNDAATALAIATGGDINGFVGMMNDKATELGLNNTHFDNPHGLHSSEHYTSAYDLAVIASHAMQNEEFKNIVGCKMYTVEANETHPTYYFGNKNKLLGLYDGANGVKTGYTKDSGRCFVGSAEKNGMQLVCVVLNIYDTYNTCAVNFDRAFDNYRSVAVGKKGDVLENISLEGLNCSLALQNDLTLPLKEGEIMGLKCYFDIDGDLDAPLAANSLIGKMEFYMDNRLLFSANIVNIEDINDIGAVRKLAAYKGDWRINVENGEIKQVFGFDGSGV